MNRTALPSQFIINDQNNPADNGGLQGGVLPPLILQYWQVAIRWKWLIAVILICSLALGLVATLLMTPQYSSTARIEISRVQKNVTNVETVDAAELGRDIEFYQTQYELLGARSLAERVVKSLKLDERQDFFDNHGVSADDEGGLFTSESSVLNKAQKKKRFDQATKVLLNHVNISPILKSSLVDVYYTSASPTLSSQVANEWVKQFVQASMDRKFSSTVEAQRFLEQRLDDLRARLERSERDAVEYASSKDIVGLARTQDADGKTVVNRTLTADDLEALNAALSKAIADRISAESRLSRPGIPGASSESLNNPAITSLRQKRAETAAEYARMMVQFEPNYPTAKGLSELIRELDVGIAREERRVFSSKQSEYTEASERENKLREQVAGLKRRLDTQQRDNIQYNIFQREADTNRQLYDSLLQRYKEIGVAGIGANNIAVIDVATPSEKPSAPSLPTNLAIALFLGLVLSGASVFALEQIDEGVRDPMQISRHLNLPLLGSVPSVGDEDTVAMLLDAKSDLSESYLSIRSNLAFSTDHGVPKSVMVTSTRPAEGKSTTSLALATVMGRTGSSVLLIDADMRSPSLHEFIGETNERGLSNYLAGENDWRKLVKPVKSKGMMLMPAGPKPPSAAELLSSDRMKVLIRELLTHYDHVVVDAPPILGLADAPLLSGAVEGCIFVIESEGVALRGVKASLGRLQSVQAHIFGAVLTKLQLRQAGYGYGYGYGYGSEKEEA